MNEKQKEELIVWLKVVVVCNALAVVIDLWKIFH
jgi:hypothetical protein